MISSSPYLHNVDRKPYFLHYVLLPFFYLITSIAETLRLVIQEAHLSAYRWIVK